MAKGRSLRTILLAVTSLAVGGCADLQRRDPLQFTVAGIEPPQGEGLELRMVSTVLGMLDGKPMDKVTYDLRSATAPSSGQ